MATNRRKHTISTENDPDARRTASRVRAVDERLQKSCNRPEIGWGILRRCIDISNGSCYPYRR